MTEKWYLLMKWWGILFSIAQITLIMNTFFKDKNLALFAVVVSLSGVVFAALAVIESIREKRRLDKAFIEMFGV